MLRATPSVHQSTGSSPEHYLGSRIFSSGCLIALSYRGSFTLNPLALSRRRPVGKIFVQQCPMNICLYYLLTELVVFSISTLNSKVTLLAGINDRKTIFDSFYTLSSDIFNVLAKRFNVCLVLLFHKAKWTSEKFIIHKLSLALLFITLTKEH